MIADINKVGIKVSNNSIKFSEVADYGSATIKNAKDGADANDYYDLVLLNEMLKDTDAYVAGYKSLKRVDRVDECK